MGMKAITTTSGVISPTRATTKPRVAARLYAGATEATPMTMFETRESAPGLRPLSTWVSVMVLAVMGPLRVRDPLSCLQFRSLGWRRWSCRRPPLLKDRQPLLEELFRDDERWEEADHVAVGPRREHHEPGLMAPAQHPAGDLPVRRDPVVPDELDAHHRAPTAHLPDRGEGGGELAQTGQHRLADEPGSLDETLGLDGADRGQGGGAGDRVAPEGPADAPRVD